MQPSIFRGGGSGTRSLRERASERPVLAASAVLALAVLLAYPAVDWWLRSKGISAPFRYWDFGAYGGAVNRWQAGDSLYLRNDNGGFHGTFLYPPVAVLLFAPFVELFGTGVSPQVWNAVGVGTLWVGLQALVAALGYDLRWYERGVLLWALLGFQPLLLGLKLGQTAPFMAGLLALAGAGVCRERGGTGESGDADGSDTLGRIAGLTSGLATAVVGFVKFAYAPVGAHLLRSRRRFGAAVAGGLVLVGLSIAVFGVEQNLAYIDVLAWGAGRGDSARSPALWLAPYYRPLFWVPGSFVLRVTGSLIVAGYALLATGADREVFALGLAAFPLLTPLAYTYYFVALLPAVVVLLAVELEHDSGYPALVLVGLLCLQFHSYGLRLLVVELPDVVPAMTALSPAYPLLQPGLWGTSCCSASRWFASANESSFRTDLWRSYPPGEGEFGESTENGCVCGGRQTGASEVDDKEAWCRGPPLSVAPHRAVAQNVSRSSSRRVNGGRREACG